MRKLFRHNSLLALGLLLAGTTIAQNKPIGYWTSYMPYQSARGIASDGVAVYVAASESFYTMNTTNSQLNAYSKVEGMSDAGMQAVAYDMATSTAVLIYSNGNIDLFKDNTFYNVPDLKIRTIAGEKNVYSVYTRNGLAYLSTSIGVIVIDLSKKKVKETYEFNLGSKTLKVKAFGAAGDYFYSATDGGLYRAPLSSNELQNYQAWKRLDTSQLLKAATPVGNDFFVTDGDSVYKVVDTMLQTVYYADTTHKIMHLDDGDGTLFVCEYDSTSYNGRLRILDTAAFAIVDSMDLKGKKPIQSVRMLDSTIWVADEFGGALKRLHDGTTSYYAPIGPVSSSSFDIYAYNRSLWVAHGGFDSRFIPLGDFSGIAHYTDDKWTYYMRFLFHPFDTLTDFSFITKDEQSGTLYAGSYSSGFFVLKNDGTYTAENRQIAGLAVDSKQNLWVTNTISNFQLSARTLDGVWYKYMVPNMQYGGPVVVDQNDQVWFVGVAGAGVGVYNTNGTLDNTTDDTYYHLIAGAGYGNLPSNTVNCIACDRNNNIWIGTANGIGIVSNCNPPFNSTGICDAELPIVQYDQYAGYLFAGNNVRTIAVDGANRKWVGTDDGIWLLSPDASTIVYRFTVDNSPLPSNRIQKISIDQATGDVYIGTEQGLVSYRSTATEGGTTNKDVLAFPNPVPSGYTGTIAIKGLVDNADVRITDISGQLVYRTKALGGQAVWNGLDYTGRKPQSGVYIVFASDATGDQTYSGKIVILK